MDQLRPNSAQMELKDLKGNLKQALKQSGALDSIRARMRKDFISSMQGEEYLHHGNGSGGKMAAVNFSLNDKVLYSIIYHTLRARNLINSLSVFSVEVGFDTQTQAKLTENDILQILNMGGSQTALYNSIIKNKNGSGVGTTNSELYNNTILYAIVSECIKRGHTAVSSASVQTDELANEEDVTSTTTTTAAAAARRSTGGGGGGGYANSSSSLSSTATTITGNDQFYGMKESLDEQLRDIRASFMHRREAERDIPNRTIEDRMYQLSYAIRTECENQFKAEHGVLFLPVLINVYVMI